MSFIINIKKKIKPINKCNICFTNIKTEKCKFCNFYMCKTCKKKWFKFKKICPHCKNLDSYSNTISKCKILKKKITYFKYYLSYYIHKFINFFVCLHCKSYLSKITLFFGYSLFIIIYLSIYSTIYICCVLLIIITVIILIYLFTCCCCCCKNHCCLMLKLL